MARVAAEAAARGEMRAARLAEALAEQLPPGVRVARSGSDVIVSASGLRRRRALDPAWRWLVERAR